MHLVAMKLLKRYSYAPCHTRANIVQVTTVPEEVTKHVLQQYKIAWTPTFMIDRSMPLAQAIVDTGMVNVNIKQS